MRDLLRNQLSVLDAKLVELGALRETLKATLTECESAIATKDASACPMIELKSDEGKDGVR